MQSERGSDLGPWVGTSTDAGRDAPGQSGERLRGPEVSQEVSVGRRPGRCRGGGPGTAGGVAPVAMAGC